MRVLVTGGAGYVGSVSVEALVAGGHDVVVLDDLSKGHREAVTPGARLVEGSYADATGLRALLAETTVDAVLHCAARSLVGESMVNPALYYRENVAGGVTLLEALREAGVRRLVFSSTAAVYGTPASVPIREDAVLAPINPYGETKRAFEGALRWYAGAYGLRSVSLRYFNVAGASVRNGEVHDPETHLIPNVLAAVEGRGEVTVFGTDYPTADGTCIRDYIHVEDLARAHLLALEATAPGDARTAASDGGSDDGARADASAGSPGGAGAGTSDASARPADRAAAIALNLGNGGGFSVREVLAAVEEATGRPVPHRIGPRRAGDPPVLVADASRARAVLGWEPAHSHLVEIVTSAWAWRRAHRGGYGASA
jgi:UDP-glucose 4-epimerase